MVCDKSTDAIQKERTDWYMERSTPRFEPEFIIKLRREANIDGLNAGAFLFLAYAVSQAAVRYGSRITTSAIGQEAATGTLRIY